MNEGENIIFARDRQITKKQAAKIAHEYVTGVLEENDIEDILGAAILKDLYDCNTCAYHVAQMFLKGIIPPDSDREFGMDRVLSEEELEEIEDRVFNVRLRRIPKTIEDVRLAVDLPRKLSKEETKGFLTDGRIIDVRGSEQFEVQHIEGAENIPLSKIMINPFIIGGDKYQKILFVCKTGMKSTMAAEYARIAGYKKVYVSNI